jgi:hypothetical protein
MIFCKIYDTLLMVKFNCIINYDVTDQKMLQLPRLHIRNVHPLTFPGQTFRPLA